MVIVTKNQYLLASKIYHITLDENVNYIDARNKHGKNVSVKQTNYTIQVIYAPEDLSTPNHQQRNSEQRECSITIRSGVDAHKVFRDMVEQIREQLTDQLYLDKALEKMLGSIDLETMNKKDKRDDDDLDAYLLVAAPKTSKSKPKKLKTKMRLKKGKHDRSSKKVRPTRKTKRRN